MDRQLEQASTSRHYVPLKKVLEMPGPTLCCGKDTPLLASPFWDGMLNWSNMTLRAITTLGPTAMSWAGLWRLIHNSSIPTTFRTDSMTTELQARGHIGNPTNTESHETIRGIFQALESLLPGDALQFCHVPGHCGEPWNELCDYLAKLEIRKSRYFRRPHLTMRTWRPALSYLWMIFSQHDGLPQFCGDGFHVPPPLLPEQQQAQPVVALTLSLCTANVNSLSLGPDGHRGKLDYLRKQFIHLGLNILGIQEARTPSSHTFVDQVVRLTSGSHGKQLGAELWVNTSQPCGRCGKKALYSLYFKREHFQVVHKDPRALLVHAVCPYFDAWFLVGHAPHSGIDEDIRTAWWSHFTELGVRRPSWDAALCHGRCECSSWRLGRLGRPAR